MRFLVALLIAALSTPVFANQPERRLEAHAVSRTELFTLRTGDGLVVRPIAVAGSGFVIGVEVYGEDKTLVGRDDEEVETPTIEWEAPRDGRYYLVVRNFSAARGAYSVTVVSSVQARSAQPPPTHAVVKVFYATNRSDTGAPPPSPPYGGEPRSDSRLSLGVARISVPRDHRMGELEGPTLLRLQFREDPEKHIVLLGVETKRPGPFFADVSAAATRTSRNEAFVFVHGFATTFDDAVRRTAQLAYDLGFEGAPIAYSWPSQGRVGLLDYNRDARNAEISSQGLKEFLERLAAEGKVSTVHVIAHSMGNRVLAGALDLFARGPRSADAPLIRQVAMMAPDIDAQNFRNLAERIRAVPSRLTLYASSGDDALRASQSVAGYPRAGQGGPDVLVLPGIDTVDASLVDTSLLGLRHSYYADNRTILSDLFYLLRGLAPQERAALQRRQHPNGVYWEFRPAVR